ncbi:MAG: aspartate ammonia-lyase [Candidatus Marsarchaeota archaeon]|nr:aspartate ammonia-lyase [Candidatus Marsarchaeota archaeon]MCL5094394.1 aspartate ammonia-lyase [Candidatus Marsarchaeota archaeon]
MKKNKNEIVEKDIVGEVIVPSNVYYGVETERALNNYRVSGLHIQREFIQIYALIKKCAAISNMNIGKLDKKKANAIVAACDEIIDGKLLDQFKIDIFQAGAGTNINMNVNEVVANRALEIIGSKKGNFNLIHPNDHINMSQSTNDTMPSVIRISTFIEIKKLLIPALKILEKELNKKAEDFEEIIKIGRTHLQDAVPMSLGQELSGYAETISLLIDNIENTANYLLEIPIGGTAIGTGINASQKYRQEIIKLINNELKMFKIDEKFILSKNRFRDTQNRVAEMIVSDALNSLAIGLNKIINDLVILVSGPRTGIHELILKPAQPGSSIMPGKINPSYLEMQNMVLFQIEGINYTIRKAVSSAQLELNVYMPIIAYNLLFSIRILSNSIKIFSKNAISELKVDVDRINKYIENDLSIVTSLTPYIGYDKASEIVMKAYKENKTIMQVCMEMKILNEKKLNELLNPGSQI